MSYSISDLQDLAEILANLDEEELEYINEVSGMILEQQRQDEPVWLIGGEY